MAESGSRQMASIEGYRVIHRKDEQHPLGIFEAFRPSDESSIGTAASLGRLRSMVSEDINIQKAARGELEVRLVKIADLYPIEPGSVRESYAFHLERYRRDEEVPRPEAIQLDGVYLIIEGCNRVAAAKAAGRTEMIVILVPASLNANIGAIIALREKQGHRGFANFPEFADESSRRDVSRQELEG